MSTHAASLNDTACPVQDVGRRAPSILMILQLLFSQKLYLKNLSIVFREPTALALLWGAGGGGDPSLGGQNGQSTSLYLQLLSKQVLRGTSADIH